MAQNKNEKYKYYIVIDIMNHHDVNNQQWDTITLQKKKTPKTATHSKILSPEEKIERQKTISHLLRQNIQKARLAKKMNQKQLATAANLQASVISELESGKRIYNESEILKIERALGVRLQRK